MCIWRHKTTDQFFLLPNRFKIAGYIMVPLGLAAAIMRFYFGIKPDAFDLKTFAIATSFLETRYFLITRNNFGEEIPGLLILVGLFFWAFSREPVETIEIQMIRLKALLLSLAINTALMVIAMLSVFGLSYIVVLSLNLFSLTALYLITFRLLLSRP